MQRYELIAEIDTLLGGRAAEQVFIKEISTGAGNDLERATDIIKAMIGLYGMSDVAGLMVLEKQQNRFISGATNKEYSEKMAENLDEYVKTMLDERYKIVVDIRNIIKEFEKKQGIKREDEEDSDIRQAEKNATSSEKLDEKEDSNKNE